MLDELTASSNLLCAAIERYSTACLAIQRSYARGEKPHITTPQLSLRMDAEAEIAALLQLKLRETITAINWSKNHSNTRNTINNLPPEILGHIFRLVHRSQPCAKRDYDTDDKTEPIYPAVLSLVCSRWREIAFDIPTLWSHIDISTSTLLNRHRLSGLMQRYLDRAGQLPLDLHIFDSPGYETSLRDPESIQKLVTQFAGRAFSLDLDARHTFEYEIHNKSVSNFFQKCTPGKFTRLTLTQYDDHEFMKGYDSIGSVNDNFNGLLVDLPAEQFEDIMSHVSILRVNQMYPLWNSRAYHGLVELRLTGAQMHIGESELIDMIRASPDLRIFQFNLVIGNPLPVDSQITPIVLNNLEILNLTRMRSSQVGILLRWLHPGSKPLQFAVTQTMWPDPSLLQLKETNSMLFFLRACVTKAYGGNSTFSLMAELLELSPNLQVLALGETVFKSWASWGVSKLAPERRLKCVYMDKCSVNVEAILALINYPGLTIQRFSFYACSFWRGGSWVPKDQTAPHLEELARNHPGVSFTIQDVREPSPIESWDLFPSYDTA
ncbi:F-box-like domain protein, putative [Rhizoctonia solani AG-3 Rhs1AP]|uniref:F-box-like domain protein, putative n=1 Tax=Rhizoctonia solani AG-3 Rhs1AP TaxID=1086054 RepID=X8J254_9AGAM|nr:F-box-like domain protein, putative [Rhizoctonia solani AG-3 Rhs1AP]